MHPRKGLQVRSLRSSIAARLPGAMPKVLSNSAFVFVAAQKLPRLPPVWPKEHRFVPAANWSLYWPYSP